MITSLTDITYDGPVDITEFLCNSQKYETKFSRR